MLSCFDVLMKKEGFPSFLVGQSVEQFVERYTPWGERAMVVVARHQVEVPFAGAKLSGLEQAVESDRQYVAFLGLLVILGKPRCLLTGLARGKTDLRDMDVNAGISG